MNYSEYLKRVQSEKISPARKTALAPLIDYLKSLETAQLNFICTHNSRRSQFAQVWAQWAADYYHFPLRSFSGGVEVTACNPRTVAALRRAGLTLNASDQSANPQYLLAREGESLALFSKLYDHPHNPTENFAAVMTCAHADENCPFIPGTQKRIALNYQDPKAFDDTEREEQAYDERCLQIASEMFYVFKTLSDD